MLFDVENNETEKKPTVINKSKKDKINKSVLKAELKQAIKDDCNSSYNLITDSNLKILIGNDVTVKTFGNGRVCIPQLDKRHLQQIARKYNKNYSIKFQ